MKKNNVLNIVNSLALVSVLSSLQVCTNTALANSLSLEEQMKINQEPIENNFKKIGNFLDLTRTIEFFDKAGYNCQKDFFYTAKAKIEDPKTIKFLGTVKCLFNFEANSIYIKKDLIKEMEKKVAKYNANELYFKQEKKDSIKLYDYFNVNIPAEVSERKILEEVKYSQKVEVYDQIPQNYINYYDQKHSNTYNEFKREGFDGIVNYLLEKGYSKRDVYNIIEAKNLSLKDYDKLTKNKITIPLVIVNVYFKEKHRPSEMERYHIQNVICDQYKDLIMSFDRNFIKINYLTL